MHGIVFTAQESMVTVANEEMVGQPLARHRRKIPDWFNEIKPRWLDDALSWRGEGEP